MLNKEEIEALELCVGIAIGEAGSGTKTDLAIEAIEKLKAAQQSVQRTGYQTALIPCPHCGVNITVDSDMLTASR